MKKAYTRFWYVVLAGGLVAAGTGCRKNCYPAETGPPPFGMAFSTDTLGTGAGFHKAEAFSAYLVRYRGPDFSQPQDTLWAKNQRQGPNVFYYVDRTMFCNFPAVGSATGPQSYRLEVSAARKRYDISAIVLEYGGSDECSRTIARLDALLNGQRVDASRGYTLTKR
jgi:hypothetical protein